MLNTNNTQNNLNYPNSLNMQQRLQDRKVFEQFLNKDKELRVTCDKPRGHLVKENPLQQFASMFTDTAHDVQNLGKALTTGQSNDFELGRMNDLGMKIGGGIIAGALMGTKSTSSKKLMELIGFGTFFSVMSLWPKVAIDLPTQIKYGFNPHQKYIDSQGRKKQFFQDNQYLPWDVWSKEDINKVADKMGVPKDMKDREEYTKEKMRTIALQDNTLWMLTAGFATPLLASLVCNRLEAATTVPVANTSLKHIAKQAEKFEGAAASMAGNGRIFAGQDKEMSELLASLRRGEIPEGFNKKLGEILNVARFADEGHSGSGEVYKIVSNGRNGTAIADDLIKRLFPSAQEFADDDFIKKLVGNAGEDELEAARKVFKKAYSDVSGKFDGNPPYEAVIRRAKNIAREEGYGDKEWARKLKSGIQGLDGELGQHIKTKGTCTRETLEQGASKLEEVYTSAVKPAQAQVGTFSRQVKRLEEVSGVKYNRVAKKFVDILGLSDREITALRNVPDADFGSGLSETLRRKVSDVASDKTKYDKVTGKLLKEQARIDKAVTKGGEEVSIGGIFKKLSDKLQELSSKAMTSLKQGTGDALEGSLLKESLQKGLTDQEVQAARGGLTSVDSMITRLLASLELEKRISDGSLLEDYVKRAQANGMKTEIQGMTKEELEKFYSHCREIVWRSSYGDAMNKFHLKGNGTEYRTLTETLFDGNSQFDSVKTWQQRVMGTINCQEYIPNPALTGNKTLLETSEACVSEMGKSHGKRFMDFGESAASAIQKQIRQKYNDRSWMKLFGGITAGLIGVTLISQLFFGKVKDEHLYKKDGDTFESGKK